MITWPNIGMIGDFKPCEPGLLNAINKNFFLLDNLVQSSFIDFTDEIPSGPSVGDTYILNSDIGEFSENSLIVWDGVKWNEVIPKSGFNFFSDSEKIYLYFDGSEWKYDAVGTGDVVGPEGSLSREIAIFDGTTGKLITQSGVVIDTDKNVNGFQGIYSETTLQNYSKSRFIEGLVYENSQSGSDVNLLAPSSIVRINGAVVSIDSIQKPPTPNSYSRLTVLINNSGSQLEVKNNSNISTGTGASIQMTNQSALLLTFDPSQNKMIVVGGVGGGSSGSSERRMNFLRNPGFENDIVEWVANSATVEIDDEDIIPTPYSSKSLKVTASGTDQLLCTKALGEEFEDQLGAFSGWFKAPEGETLQIFINDSEWDIVATGKWQPFKLNGNLIPEDDNMAGIRNSGSIVYHLSSEVYFGLEGDLEEITLVDVPAILTIPMSYRRPMMVVNVLEADRSYQLLGGITNNDWAEYGRPNYMIVGSAAARLGLGNNVRKNGLMVYQADTGQVFILGPALDNTAWRVTDINNPRINQNFTSTSNGQQIENDIFTQSGDYTIAVYVDDSAGVGHSLNGTNPFLNDNLKHGNRITLVNISPNPLYIPGRNDDNPGCSIYSEPITLVSWQSATYEYMGNEGISTNPIYALISKSN